MKLTNKLFRTITTLTLMMVLVLSSFIFVNASDNWHWMFYSDIYKLNTTTGQYEKVKDTTGTCHLNEFLAQPGSGDILIKPHDGQRHWNITEQIVIPEGSEYNIKFDVPSSGFEILTDFTTGHTYGSLFTIEADNVTLDFNGIELEPCKAGADDGGLFYISGNNVKVKNFKTDYVYFPIAEDCGGAVYVDGDNCSIEDATFSGCNAYYGGAVYLNGYNTKVINCTFNGCHAGNDGGAIYADDDAEITGCHFTDNTAEDCGGSIISGNGRGEVKIKKCDFAGGSCGDVGIWVDCWNDAVIEECTPGDKDHYYKPASIDSASQVSSIFSNGSILIIVVIALIAAITIIVLKKRKTKKINL